MNKNGGNGEAYLNGKPAKNFYKNDKPLKNSSAGQWVEAKALQQGGYRFSFFFNGTTIVATLFSQLRCHTYNLLLVDTIARDSFTALMTAPVDSSYLNPQRAADRPSCCRRDVPRRTDRD